jgi:hypothetical protein
MSATVKGCGVSFPQFSGARTFLGRNTHPSFFRVTHALLYFTTYTLQHRTSLTSFHLAFSSREEHRSHSTICRFSTYDQIFILPRVNQIRAARVAKRGFIKEELLPATKDLTLGVMPIRLKPRGCYWAWVCGVTSLQPKSI